MTDATESGTRCHSLGIESHYRSMQESCRQILEETLKSPHKELLASSHLFVSDLSNWNRILKKRPEQYLISTATTEYQHALLAVAQGQYRQAFKSLRLVLELSIQAIYLSVHILELQEWLDGFRDTNWSTLVDENQSSAVLTPRYARVFFAELEADMPHYRAMAKNLYRECSECVHGNVPKHISLPEADKLEFDDQSLKLWCTKADTVALLVSFLLTLRYTKEFSEKEISEISEIVLERLGHLSSIRVKYGGVAT
jgi:hypothetical protein